jgi:hypothetical protein
MNQRVESTNHPLHACMDAEAAARFLGWAPYFMPFLARAGHLKPLGKPTQNAR